MAWLSGAWKIIQNLPTLISIAKTVYDAYLEFKMKKEAAERKRKLEEAAKKAEKTKDTTDLENSIS